MSKKIKDETKEEIVYDDSDNSTSSFGTPESKLKKLKEKLKECQKEKTEYLDGWQRTKADFINFKKRSEENKKDFARYASEDIIMQLLPLVDNFEQAFKNKEIWESVDSNWRKGVEMIYNQLINILKDNNVTEVESLGNKFDPQLHECIETIEVEDKKDDDKILEVIQKGYKIGNKIIRHPNVKVGRKS